MPRVRASAVPAVVAVAAVVAAVPLLLASCATTGPATVSAESAVVLGPGGSAVGHVALPAGVDTKLELENEGPGQANYVIRLADGETLASGALREASVGLYTAGPAMLIVVLEAQGDAGTRIEYELETAGRLDLTWDLSRAAPPAAPK